jgi:hypothetical protein
MCFGRQPSGHLLCSPEPSSIHLQITARLSILNEHLQRPRLLVEAQGPTYQPAARRSSKGLWDPSPPASTLHCHPKHTTRQRELPLSHGAGSPRITSGPRDPGTGEGGGKLLCSYGCPAELNSRVAGLRTATPYKRHDGSTCHVLYFLHLHFHPAAEARLCSPHSKEGMWLLLDAFWNANPSPSVTIRRSRPRLPRPSHSRLHFQCFT